MTMTATGTVGGAGAGAVHGHPDPSRRTIALRTWAQATIMQFSISEVAALHEAGRASWQIRTDQPQSLVIGLFIGR
jgi:hypothetical protein